jgi:hypothetical protein
MNAESPHAEVVLPQPVIEKYARLGMTSPAADVAATTYHYGFDRFTYPGDTVMQYWWSNTPMFWTGFYLAPAPQHSDTSWMTKYNTARHMGWGFCPSLRRPPGRRQQSDGGSRQKRRPQCCRPCESGRLSELVPIVPRCRNGGTPPIEHDQLHRGLGERSQCRYRLPRGRVLQLQQR